MPVIQDAAVSPFGFQFGGRKRLDVPIAPPADSKGGVFRVHLPVTDKGGQKSNQRIEAVEVNLQPVAMATEASVKRVIERQGATYAQTEAARGNLAIPEALDIPLAPGEVKLLSLRTLPLVGESFHDFQKVTTRLAIEWIENKPEGQ